MSYEVSDFNKEVIEASHNRPILVDFWAPWCGPCRTLSPILEKLAEAAGDQWTLVTVNSDNHQELSVEYGVRGIPAVKLFSQGKVIAEFTGAMPEYSVKQWLEQEIPSDTKKALSEAKRLLGEGASARAIELLESLSQIPEAGLLLGSLIVLSDPERSLELVSDIPADDPSSRLVKHAIVTVAEAMTADTDSLPEGTGRALYSEALTHLRDNQVRPALEALMQILLKDRYYGDDAARKLGVALFTLLGPTHETTKALRRTFDMYLY